MPDPDIFRLIAPYVVGTDALECIAYQSNTGPDPKRPIIRAQKVSQGMPEESLDSSGAYCPRIYRISISKSSHDTVSKP